MPRVKLNARLAAIGEFSPDRAIERVIVNDRRDARGDDRVFVFEVARGAEERFVLLDRVALIVGAAPRLGRLGAAVRARSPVGCCARRDPQRRTRRLQSEPPRAAEGPTAVCPVSPCVLPRKIYSTFGFDVHTNVALWQAERLTGWRYPATGGRVPDEAFRLLEQRLGGAPRDRGIRRKSCVRAGARWRLFGRRHAWDAGVRRTIRAELPTTTTRERPALK